MKPYKVREDEIGTSDCECHECYKKFKDKDVILELYMYDEYFKFCSSECIMKWMEDDITKRQIEVYPLTQEQRTYKEIFDVIKSIEPNSKVRISDNLYVEYFEIEGMQRHYLVYGVYGLNQVTFTTQADVVNYILKKLK